MSNCCQSCHRLEALVLDLDRRLQQSENTIVLFKQLFEPQINQINLIKQTFLAEAISLEADEWIASQTADTLDQWTSKLTFCFSDDVCNNL